jgi:hypothetical protein
MEVHMTDEPWYGAKCIFLHTKIQSQPGQVYEERILLLRAESFDEAVKKAEAEAEEYARDAECSYINFVDVFHVYDNRVGEGSVVYSLMRRSDLDEGQYLDRFCDTGAELSEENTEAELSEEDTGAESPQENE